MIAHHEEGSPVAKLVPVDEDADDVFGRLQDVKAR